MNDKRLIEEAFPLKQASIDSVHEKNVRHGHISTLHIWPARRPLAASRAALIAALLPDPGDVPKREALLSQIGGRTVEVKGKAETLGGILHWGREESSDLLKFRDEIRKSYGGNAPHVLDMFAGGGAIPLEAMRLGCRVTAVDYNPVAWLVLKCTLQFPQSLAAKTWALPEGSSAGLFAQGDAGLSEHLLYWGQRLLEAVKQDLSRFYPVLPLDPEKPVSPDNPPSPTVAYLWARTVPHPDPTEGGLDIPLLKTLWLCKKPGKKRALRLTYNEEAKRFDFDVFTPSSDEEVERGTMSRRGVQCPPTSNNKAGLFIRSDYIQQCAKSGQMGAVCTAVVVDSPCLADGSGSGKEYRRPSTVEHDILFPIDSELKRISATLPYGLPTEPIPHGASRSGGGSAFTVPLYGLTTWKDLFNTRQLLALATFVHHTRNARAMMADAYSNLPTGERELLIEALMAYLALAIDRLADYGSTIAIWVNLSECMGHTFSRFALPMTWDYAECNPIGGSTGGFSGALDWVKRAVDHLCKAASDAEVTVLNASATEKLGSSIFDLIVTDPPYYDAIPYSELSDFFYVWLRRLIGEAYPREFEGRLSPKSEELIQNAEKHSGDQTAAKKAYEQGMFRAFLAACESLKPDGRMVIVFAHKQPDAWETLVSAMIRAGFVVTASWPIDTERSIRLRSIDSAALSSSVWLVCRKRAHNAGKGWYKQVQPRMRDRIIERLRYFWDAGVRGPDFLWAAVGPGLEAFSTFDEVRRNDGSPFSVSDFLKEVRRITTDFALGQIIHGGTEGLDECTSYALMHRQNFGDGGAPFGECILLSGAYGLNLDSLSGSRGVLTRCKVKSDTDSSDDEGATVTSGGSELRLLRWDERRRDDLGEPHPTSGLLYIDMLHRLMREWATGDVSQVAEYAERQGLGQNDLFWRVAQAFAEMSELGSRERTILEALISWGRGRVPTGMRATARATAGAGSAKTLKLDL